MQGELAAAFANIGLDATAQDVAILINQALKKELKNPKLIQDAINRGFDEQLFQDTADTLRQSIRFVNLFIGDLDKAFGEFARQISTISVDALSAISISPTSDNKRLLEQVGINLNDFNTQIRRDAETLNDFLSSGGIRSRISDFFEGTNLESDILGLQELFGNIFGNPDIAQEALDRIGPVIGNIAAQLGQTSLDVIKNVASSTNLEEFIREANPLVALEETLAEIVRSRVDIYNQQITKEREINDAIRNNVTAIIDFNSALQDLQFQLSESRTAQQDFVTDNRNTVEINRRTARGLIGQATTSQFGSNSAFATQILNARQLLNAVSQNTSRGIRSGTVIRDIATTGGSRDVDALSAAQGNFAALQAELSSRLSELQGRIGAASTASDTLRNAFETLRSSIVAAGQTITGFTGQDLASIFNNLERFAGAGGISNPGAALNALNLPQNDFNQLIQLSLIHISEPTRPY